MLNKTIILFALILWVSNFSWSWVVALVSSGITQTAQVSGCCMVWHDLVSISRSGCWLFPTPHVLQCSSIWAPRGESHRFHRWWARPHKTACPSHSPFRGQSQARVVTWAADPLAIRGPLQGSFARAAHATLRNVLLTRLLVYYKRL